MKNNIENLKRMASGDTSRPRKDKAMQALAWLVESMPHEYNALGPEWQLVYNYIDKVGPASSSIKCPFKYAAKFLAKYENDMWRYRNIIVYGGYMYACDGCAFFRMKTEKDNGYYDKNGVQVAKDRYETDCKDWLSYLDNYASNIIKPENIQLDTNYTIITGHKNWNAKGKKARYTQYAQYPWFDENNPAAGGLHSLDELKRIRKFKLLGDTHYWAPDNSMLIIGTHDCLVGTASMSEKFYLKMIKWVES